MSEHCQLLSFFQNQLALFGMVIMMLRITGKTSAGMETFVLFFFRLSPPRLPPFTPKFGYLSRIFPIVASENISFNLEPNFHFPLKQNIRI